MCDPKGLPPSGQNFRKRSGQNFRNPQEPTFVPQRGELFEIVKAWQRNTLSNLWFYFGCPEYCVGTRDWAELRFGQERIRQNAQVIGRELVTSAIAQAFDEFSQGMDSCEWRVFRYGTKAERDEMRAGFLRKLEEEYRAEESQRSCDESPRE